MSESPSRSVPRLSAAVVLPLALLGVLLLGLAWLLRMEREQTAALREELTSLRLAQRAAASEVQEREAAIRRAARLDETMDRIAPEPVPASTEARAPESTLELERVIRFLREELKAAHETIERLKQPDPDARPTP